MGNIRFLVNERSRALGSAFVTSGPFDRLSGGLGDSVADVLSVVNQFVAKTISSRRWIAGSSLIPGGKSPS
jgi:hypothetical protein